MFRQCEEEEEEPELLNRNQELSGQGAYRAGGCTKRGGSAGSGATSPKAPHRQGMGETARFLLEGVSGEGRVSRGTAELLAEEEWVSLLLEVATSPHRCVLTPMFIRVTFTAKCT